MNAEELSKIRNSYFDPVFVDSGMYYYLVLHGYSDDRRICLFPVDINCDTHSNFASEGKLAVGSRLKNGLLFSVFDCFSQTYNTVRIRNNCIYVNDVLKHNIKPDQHSQLTRIKPIKVMCKRSRNLTEFLVERNGHEMNFILYDFIDGEPYFDSNHNNVEFTAKRDGDIIDEQIVGWIRSGTYNYRFPGGFPVIYVYHGSEIELKIEDWDCSCTILYNMNGGDESFRSYNSENLEHEFIMARNSTKSARKI